MITLGTCPHGGTLAYDQQRVEFALGETKLDLEQVRAMDARGQVHWRYLEQRDWLRRLNADDFAQAHEHAISLFADPNDLDQQIKNHVKRDDGYLYGKIVEEAPSAEAEVVASGVPQDPEKRGLLATLLGLGGTKAPQRGMAQQQAAQAQQPQGQGQANQQAASDGAQTAQASDSVLITDATDEHGRPTLASRPISDWDEDSKLEQGRERVNPDGTKTQMPSVNARTVMKKAKGAIPSIMKGRQKASSKPVGQNPY